MTQQNNHKIQYHDATFLLSAAKLIHLPSDEGIEVAFVGRSNAGKSSVLNQLTENKKLARTSKTPGRTQHINLFRLDDSRRLVDLPGYGYAKVSAELKAQWQKTLGDYLQTRECLKGLILVMDIRHPLTDFDKNLLTWSSQCDLPVHILLNKCDKLSFSAIKKTSLLIQKYIDQFPNLISFQSFSALKNLGVNELRSTLNQWFLS